MPSLGTDVMNVYLQLLMGRNRIHFKVILFLSQSSRCTTKNQYSQY